MAMMSRGREGCYALEKDGGDKEVYEAEEADGVAGSSRCGLLQLKLGNFSNNSVYNCTLTGVRSGLTRHGDAVLNVTEDRATFDFGLSIKDSTLQCFWKYK
ncbi:hypothetical protein SK128_012217, partial [Halocaridina rubra]